MIRVCAHCGSKNRVPYGRIAEPAKCGHCHRVFGTVDSPFAIESTADFDALVRESPLPVVIDFWAAWCAPCRVVAPEVEKLAKSRAGRALVAKLDTEHVPDVARRFRIESIPTLALFENGHEVRRIAGAMHAAEIASRLGLG